MGSEGKEMGNIVLKLKNVAQGVGMFPSVFAYIFNVLFQLKCILWRKMKSM